MLVLMTAVLVHEQPLTLVVMPDIQYYTDLRLQLFRLYWDPPTDNLTHVYTQQLQWVVSTQHRLNTRAVIFMGDLTQADAPEEWAAVRKGLRKLEAARPPVPYCLLQGDHDLGYEYTGVPPFMARKAAHRRSQVDGNVNSAVTAQPHWRGAFQSEHPVANSWYELSTNSPLAPMLVICLEYRPRDSALQWAAGVLRSHPRHDAIVVTHDYLNATSGARSDYSHLNTAQADGSNAVRGSDGEQLFQMIRRHPNVFLVLCGHDDGEGYLLSRGDHGQPIHQLMSNYQQWPNGGARSRAAAHARRHARHTVLHGSAPPALPPVLGPTDGQPDARLHSAATMGGVNATPTQYAGRDLHGRPHSGRRAGGVGGRSQGPA